MSKGPLASIKSYCYWCGGDSHEEATLCPAVECPIHPLRKGIKPPSYSKSVIKSIRERCLDCSGYEMSGVKNCTFTDCSLYTFRMGKNPNRSQKTYETMGQEASGDNTTTSGGSSSLESNEQGEFQEPQGIETVINDIESGGHDGNSK